MARKMDDVVEELREAATKALGDVGRSLKKNADDVADGIRKHADARRDLDSDMARSGSDSPGGNTSDSTTPDGSNHDGDRDIPPCRDPVDAATGAVYLQQTDLTLPGDLPLTLTRQHSSDWSYGHWFGPLWSSTFDERVDVHTDLVGRRTAVVVAADTRAHVFKNLTVGEEARPVSGGAMRLQVGEEGTYRLLDTATGQTRHYGTVVGGRAWLSSITNASGDWIRFARDEQGAPAEVTHSAGYRVRVATAEHRVTGLTVTRLDGADAVQVMSYRYDDHGDLVGVVNGSGEELEFGYDQQHRLTRWVDRNGTFYDYVYDDRGRCVSQGGSDGVMRSTFAYGEPNASGLRETRVTDSCGLTTVFKINARYQVVAIIDPLGAATSSEWSEQNQLLARTDPLGRRTTFAYDAAGSLTDVIRPDGSQVTMEWVDTVAGPRLARQVLPDGSVTTQGYDEAGRRTSVTDATGATTTFGYGDDGHLASVTDALGNVRTIETDPAGLPRVVTDADGVATRLDHDAFGRVTKITDALGATVTFAWTAASQLGSRTLPDGTEENWIYDGEGNPVEYTDSAGRVTRTKYTHFNLPAAVTAPDGTVTRYAYDTELRLRQVTNPQGAAWLYDYDSAGRLVAETDYNGRTLRYEYDSAGQLTRRVNGAGEAVTFEYDQLGNITVQRVGETVTVLTHDPLGRLLRATGPEVELVFEHDSVGRIVAESINGRTISSSYDPIGRRLTRTTPSGVETTWAYSASPEPTAVTVNGHRIGFDRDLLGREIHRDLGAAALDQTWDALGQLTSQTLATSPMQSAGSGPADRVSGAPSPTGSSRHVLQQRDYSYAVGGDLVGVDDRLTGARRFELDLASRITSVSGPDWSEIYAYDPMGNIIQAAAGTADSERREYDGTLMTRSGRYRYRYDAQGRLVGRTKARISQKPETWAYEWDADDRMIGVRTPDGTRWRYLYDVLGRRVAKHRLTESGDVVEEIGFAWDDTLLIEETTTTGSRSWAYDGLQPIAQVEWTDDQVDSRFYALVTDLVGAPTELLTAEGDLAWHARRTVWGAPVAHEEEPVPLRFAGQYADAESGLNYNLNRYYDPGVGRYVSQDPLGLEPAPNPTAYVHNPTMWMDPLGLNGINGALRDPNNGRFAPNPNTPPAPVSSGTHGNSRDSTATNWLYRRVSEDGTFQKWGITQNLKGRYSAVALDGDRLIAMTSGTRNEMLNLERFIVERDPGPMNKESFAGSRLDDVPGGCPS